MLKRDHRYDYIKIMISQGKITGFNDIFKYIPKTVVANDVGKKVDRFTDLMNRVEKFTLEELFIIAKYCEITESEMFDLVLADYRKKHGNNNNSI
jgi:hypothetical protein